MEQLESFTTVDEIVDFLTIKSSQAKHHWLPRTKADHRCPVWSPCCDLSTGPFRFGKEDSYTHACRHCGNIWEATFVTSDPSGSGLIYLNLEKKGVAPGKFPRCSRKETTDIVPACVVPAGAPRTPSRSEIRQKVLKVQVPTHPPFAAPKKVWVAYAADKEAILSPSDLKMKKKDLVHKIMQLVGF